MWGGYNRSICLLLKIQLFKFNFFSHSQSAPTCSRRLFIRSLNLPAMEPEVTGFCSAQPCGGLSLSLLLHMVPGAQSPRKQKTDARHRTAMVCDKNKRYSQVRKQRRERFAICCGNEAPSLCHAGGKALNAQQKQRSEPGKAE